MKHEKVYTEPNGRQILIMIQGSWTPDYSGIETDVQVLIRDVKEEYFHPPIGPTHPKYWKIQGMIPQKVQVMQIRYSGVSAKQLRKAMEEFELSVMNQNLLCENQ